MKLDRGGHEDMLAMLDGASAAVASAIQQYVVDRKVNNSRTVDTTAATVIKPAA